MEILQGVWKQHLRPRAVVRYGLKIFLPSPPNYVTRSPGGGVYQRLLAVREFYFEEELLMLETPGLELIFLQWYLTLSTVWLRPKFVFCVLFYVYLSGIQYLEGHFNDLLISGILMSPGLTGFPLPCSLTGIPV